MDVSADVGVVPSLLLQRTLPDDVAIRIVPGQRIAQDPAHATPLLQEALLYAERQIRPEAWPGV